MATDRKRNTALLGQAWVTPPQPPYQNIEFLAHNMFLSFVSLAGSSLDTAS